MPLGIVKKEEKKKRPNALILLNLKKECFTFFRIKLIWQWATILNKTCPSRHYFLINVLKGICDLLFHRFELRTELNTELGNFKMLVMMGQVYRGIYILNATCSLTAHIKLTSGPPHRMVVASRGRGTGRGSQGNSHWIYSFVREYNINRNHHTYDGEVLLHKFLLVQT